MKKEKYTRFFMVSSITLVIWYVVVTYLYLDPWYLLNYLKEKLTHSPDTRGEIILVFWFKFTIDIMVYITIYELFNYEKNERNN